MLKVIVFVLCAITFSLPSSPNRCVLHGNEQCQSDVCFSHFHTVPEGHVEQFDCSGAPSRLNETSCLQMLGSSNKSSICIGNDDEMHCCCRATSPASVCAPQSKRLDEQWTTEQTLYLLFGHVALLIVVGLFGALYRTAVRQWPSDNLKVEEKSKLHYVLLAAPLLLILSLLVLYFPFRKHCMPHPKGIFVTPRLFLYQIFDAGMGPSMYFSFPLVFFLFDVAFYVRVEQDRMINKSGAVSLSLFKLVTIPLLVYETFIASVLLWHKDRQPGYCRLDAAITQLMISHLLVVLYQSLLVAQTVLLFRMAPNIDVSQTSDEQVSSHVATLLSTQTAETRIEYQYDGGVHIFPRPFSVQKYGTDVLHVNNLRDVWVVLRVLVSSTGFYRVHPSKFFIPPRRQISMIVEHCWRGEMPSNVSHNLLLEWFTLAEDHPTVDTRRVWDKPYLVPQHKWQYYVLPIYLDDSKYEKDSDSQKYL